jgi:hypothetical protein
MDILISSIHGRCLNLELETGVSNFNNAPTLAQNIPRRHDHAAARSTRTVSVIQLCRLCCLKFFIRPLSV